MEYASAAQAKFGAITTRWRQSTANSGPFSKMKRKLPSSAKRKGNQEITKFFKSLTSQGPRKNCSPMSNVVKEKPSVDSEFRVPRLQNAENSLDSKDGSTMLNLDSKENDKGTSCNSNVKSAHSAVCSSSHQGNNQATTSFTDSSSVTEKSICRSVVKDHAAETSLMDCDETFHSTNEEIESSYYSCGGSVMDSTNNDFIESIDIDAGKGEDPDTDLNEGSFFEETGLHSHSRKGSRPKDRNDKGESSTCKDLKEGDQEDDVLNDCAISKAPTGSSTPLESKTKGVSKDEYNGFDILEERRQSSICDDTDTDQINKPDVYFNEIANNTVSPAESGAIACKEADQNSSCDELKEDSDNKDSDRINNHDKNFHEDSNDGTYPNGSDSSDEDLLTPPRFLYEKTKLKPDIRTPEKGIAPIYATPSPTAKDVGDEKTIKYKLSFEKLIAEKAKHRERDAELAKMEAELQQGIENGGIGQMQVPSSFSDIESEEELTDDGRDLRDCTLPQDIKKFLVEVHDFSEELPGEDVFPVFHPYVTSQDFPCLSMVPHPEGNSFEAKLLSASDIELEELLCGGWILQHYLDKPCPSEVAEWLFQVMCRHRDQHIISSSFRVLWIMLEAATEDRDDIPQNSRGTSWVPNVRTVLKELFSYGARVPRLYPGDLVNQLKVREVLSSENSTEEIQMEEETVSGGPQTEYFPVVNIMHLVQLLTHSLQRCPHSYTIQDLRNLMVLLCRLALDARLQTVVFDIEMCIAAVLNCFGEMQWPDEIKELCSIVAKLSTNHRNLLYLVEIQPPSTYGIELQRRLSLTLLHWLVLKFHKWDQTDKNPVDDRCNVAVPDDVEVSSLVKLVAQIKSTEESDYFLLHTIISLISLAVGSEDLPSKERPSLEKLTNKLRTLNGDIKDPRAAFMNRTKVKDLLVRTIFRLANMTQCIKPPREHHITSYFEYSNSDYQVELLKENDEENVEEFPENEEEEAMTGVQEMDSSTS